MGLVICRSIIEAHGGQLWAAACKPQGALFQFTIPISPGAASWSGDVGYWPILLKNERISNLSLAWSGSI